MAKVKLNAAFGDLRGSVDGLIFKRYKTGIVLSRSPRMSQIKPSPAQLAQRERFRRAAKFYRKVLADPVMKRRYTATAKSAEYRALRRHVGSLHEKGRRRLRPSRALP